MGYVRIKVLFANLEAPAKREEVELLADTGAFYTLLPPDVVSRLGLEPMGRRRFKLADGRVVERSYTSVRVELAGEVGATIAIIGQEGTSLFWV